MKPFISIFVITILLSSCKGGFATLEATKDKFNYESIVNSTGTVTTKVGDSTKVFEHATIVYSLTDASTILLKTKEGKYVYIQGPAVVELDSLDANP